MLQFGHPGLVALLLAGVPVSFAEVQEAVRLSRQTAIGYIRASAGSTAASKDVEKQRRKAILGCSASHRVTFGEADRIVAIAVVSSAYCRLCGACACAVLLSGLLVCLQPASSLGGTTHA